MRAAIFAFAFAPLAFACGSSTKLETDADASTDAVDADTPCDHCAADQACFHSWQCGGSPSPRSSCGTGGAGGCTCSCDTVPTSCPSDRPCSSTCGNFNLPPAGTKDVYCFGS